MLKEFQTILAWKLDTCVENNMASRSSSVADQIELVKHI